MGRHSKPSRHAVRTATLTATGVIAGLAVSQGVAEAAPPTGPPGGWWKVVECESGGNSQAQNPTSTASGEFQFIDGTWLSNGGGKYAKKAKWATAAQQALIAAKVFQQQGMRPWTASEWCWGSTVRAAAKRGAPAPTLPVLANMLHPTGAVAPKPAPKPVLKPVAPDKLAAQSKSTGRHHRHHRGDAVEVRAGDTLCDIADKHGMSWRELWNANRTLIHDPNLINPGEWISIPT